MRHFGISTGLALCFIQTCRAAIGPITDLNIVNVAAQPDGFSRQTVLAEGTFPGPLLRGKKGDNFKINVVNHLTNKTMLTDTSVHWHGIFQKKTNWADGTAFITQCPIASGQSFLYDFNVPDQAGTFWYHSHIGAQYCDGLRGPMVVYDDHDPYLSHYDVDDESTVITLADWYHRDKPEGPTAPPPVPDSILINGLGRSVGGTSPLAVISVKRGKRYRLRLVAALCDSHIDFSIDRHLMTIIEADGEYTEPLVVDSIRMFAGQRYSVILNANQKVDNYWIRVPSDTGPQGFDGGVNSAILRYIGAKKNDPTTPLTVPQTPLVEADLHSRLADGHNMPESGDVDVRIHLDLDVNLEARVFLINGVTFVPPPVPVLLQILSGARSAQDLLPSGSIYTLPRNKVVEVSFSGADVIGAPHPFHLHGHAFSVVRSAGSSTYNTINPVRRDVVSVGDKGDNVTIRFTTNNAGPWFFHCHLDPHLVAGMAIVFAEDTEDTAVDNPVPTAWSDLCNTYNSQPS